MRDTRPMAGPAYIVSPPLTVAVLILDLRPRNPHVLGVTRKDNVLNWCLPGGKIRRRETAAEAAARELHEETGFAVSPKFRKHGKPVGLDIERSERMMVALYEGFDGEGAICLTFMPAVPVPTDYEFKAEEGTLCSWIPFAWLLDPRGGAFASYHQRMVRALELPVVIPEDSP